MVSLLRHCTVFALLFATLGALSAQSLAPGHLVGWAANRGPSTVCSSVYTQDVEGGCQAAVHRGNSLCSPKNAKAGATAYDPRLQAVWVSDGVDIALHDLATRRILCKVPAVLAAKDNVVSGLALSDDRRELYQLEDGNQVLAISSYDVRTPCRPVHNNNACIAKNTGTSARAGGLAYDEARDLLYYATSLAGIIDWQNWIQVVRPSKPCSPVATFGVRYCGSRPGSAVAGLGYDAASQRLYLTGGKGIRILQLTDPLNGRFTDVTGAAACCGFTGIGDWAGLDVVPAWQKRLVGTGCADRPCGPCAPQLDLVGGDASLGNRDFGFQLSGAPGGSQGMFFAGVGPCTAGAPIPGLCGPVHVPLTAPWPALLGVFPVGGAPGQCNGTGKVVTGVPPDPALLKVSLCTQWLLICPTGGIWTGLSNAVEFRVGG